MHDTFHKLTVQTLRPEIDGAATSVTFAVPGPLSGRFQWTAGQHLTLKFEIDGIEHRRCYTISSPPGHPMRITAKRVPGGVVSNHIGDRLQPGDVVQVMPPFGGFTLHPAPLARRTHYFLGAGSGITPLFAMIADLLEREPHSVAHLVLGNNRADRILLLDELETLARAHPDRLSLRHVLSRPSLWSWFSPWRTGRVDAGAVAAAIAEAPPVAQDVQYWICGPGRMNTDIRSALMEMDVPAGRIHMESFGGAADTDDSVTGIAASATVVLNGAEETVPVAAGQTILQALRAAGLSPPFSCQSGVCGACRARLTGGGIHMRAHMALEQAEIDDGAVLTCQAVATSGRLRVEFPGR